MDLRQLEVFARVVETRSFSRAAEALRLTQSTISEHVRLLEEEVGVRLFDRLGRETVPTRAGELLYGYAQRLLALRAEAQQALQQFLGQISGGLTVGASTIPGEYVLPPLIGAFREKFPQVSIALHIGDSREIADSVVEGRVELGLIGARPEQRTLQAVELMPDELVVVVPPGHAWFGRKLVTLDELKPEPLIVREPGSGSRQALETALDEAGPGLGGLRVIAEMGSTSAIKQAVKAGVGLSIMSKRAVEEECRHGLLWCLTIKDLRFTRHFYVVTHTGRSRSPLCQAFLDFLL
ncbi:MAG TPA: selenium metabolism-associated LysR family transcriptional regulator, partial [Methylomirabilota bacterium]|nr:selenium metabolism-associated LysR family transcriptional regulator [Methylomirabilota bacterium]